MPLDGQRNGPLVCTSHSVRTIQRDIKVQSRRLCKRPKDMARTCGRCWFSAVPTPHEDLVDAHGMITIAGAVFGTTPYLKVPHCEHTDTAGDRIRSPYGRKGDLLWVRESYRELDDGTFVYRADSPDTRGPWRNVRFAIKRSARTWLEVLDVQVQRLQDMTVEDAIAEGVEDDDPLPAFARAWDAINGKRDGGIHRWADNPWVWRLLFRRIAA